MESSGESERLGTPGRARFRESCSIGRGPTPGVRVVAGGPWFGGLDIPGKGPVRAIIVQDWLYVVL